MNLIFDNKKELEDSSLQATSSFVSQPNEVDIIVM